jgi:Flp pilus assembly protein TadG
MFLYIKFLLRSLDCDRGSIAVIIALAFIPILIGAGAALDFGRAYLVKARLSYALDTAGLAIGASNPSANLQQILNNFFKANYSANEIGTAATPSFEIKDGVITLAVKAKLETTFLNLFGKKFIDINANSEVTRNTKGLEVVLVLDNTGSMGRGGKIDALKSAANTLVNDLFRDETMSTSIKIGLVPFVTTVNIGNNGNGTNPFVPGSQVNTYPPADSSWKGCVEARQSPHDTLDTYDARSPVGVSGNWNPYYWEAETADALEGSLSRFCQNPWWNPPAPLARIFDNPQRGSGRPNNPFPRGGSYIGLDVTPPTTRGPNQACPGPVTPLTNQKSQLTRAINTMQPWSQNGTMANLGAVWGWRLLSPTPPFEQGSAYDNEKINKAIVIMTDGVNLVSRINTEQFSNVVNCDGGRRCSNARICDIVSGGRYTSQYTGYGYISEGKLGTTNLSNAGPMLNSRLTQVCDNIKQKGIVIFTVVFQLNNPQLQTLFQNCATTPGNFFNSPDNEKLASAFRAIGAELNSLRVSK